MKKLLLGVPVIFMIVGAMIMVIIGFGMEFFTMGNFQFFGLISYLTDDLLPPLFLNILGVGYFPGEIIIVTILVYAFIGAFLGLILGLMAIGLVGSKKGGRR